MAVDTWVVVLVRGTDGVSRPLFPVVPNDLDATTNTTLAGLTDGNLGEDGVSATAFTNPIFIDVDGNGLFDPPDAQGVGGLSFDLDVDGLPLEASDSSGRNAGLIAGIVVSIAVGAVTLSGAAWYARRRWLR